MNIPKYYTIKIYSSGKISLDDDEIEYYQREGFREEQLKEIFEKKALETIFGNTLRKTIFI